MYPCNWIWLLFSWWKTRWNSGSSNNFATEQSKMVTERRVWSVLSDFRSQTTFLALLIIKTNYSRLHHIYATRNDKQETASNYCRSGNQEWDCKQHENIGTSFTNPKTLTSTYKCKIKQNRYQSNPFIEIGYLEFQVVWVLATGETEFFSKVSLQEFVSGEGGQNTSVDSLLVGLSLFRGLKRI